MAVIDDLQILDLFRGRVSAAGAVRGLCIGSSVDRWLVPEACWTVTTADPVRALSQEALVDAVIVHDLPRTESILKTRGFRPRRLLTEASALLEASGCLFFSFRRPTLALLRRRSQSAVASLLSVYRRIKSLGLRPSNLLWMHDDLESPGLYRVEKVYPAKGFSDLLRCAKFALAGSEVALIAERCDQPSRPSWLRQLSHEPPFVDCETPRDVRIGSAGSYVVDMGKAIVRIPLLSKAVPRCRNNFTALEALAAADLSLPVPRSVGTGELGSRKYFVESRLHGKSIDYTRTASRKRKLQRQAALAAIELIHSLTESFVTLVPSDLERIFRGPVRELARLLHPETAESLTQIVEWLCGRLLGRCVRLVRIHGDFKSGNILWTKDGRVVGIVDWDLSQAQGLPLIDLLTYRAFDHSQERKITMAEALYSLGIAGPGHPRSDCSEGIIRRACGLMALVHYSVNATIDEDEQRRLWCETWVTQWIERGCGILTEMINARGRKAPNDQ